MGVEALARGSGERPLIRMGGELHLLMGKDEYRLGDVLRHASLGGVLRLTSRVTVL